MSRTAKIFNLSAALCFFVSNAYAVSKTNAFLARQAAGNVTLEILKGEFPGQISEADALIIPTDPNGKDDHGMTQLMRAAKDGNTEWIKAVLALPGLRVDETDGWQRTALFYAAIHGQPDAVSLLIEAHADPRIFDRDGETALMHAAVLGNPKTCAALLDSGADIINQISPAGDTPLILSVMGGRASAAAVLASAPNAKLNVKNKMGTTALLRAATYGGSKEFLLALLDHGADKDLTGDFKDYRDQVYQDYSPLLGAVVTGNSAAVEALLARNANANYQEKAEKNNALLLALKNDQFNTAALIAAAPGLDLNAKNAAGTTALISAALRGGKEDLMLLLINKGADKDLPGNFRNYDTQLEDYTPLMAAAYAKNLAAVKGLLAKNVNVNYRSKKDGLTALGLAKKPWANMELINFLLAAGAKE